MPAKKKAAKVKPVSTAQILREINKTKSVVREKMKTASLVKQKDLDLEMKALEQCKKILNTIWFC